MDLVTQGILGGAIGQVGFQDKLGKKAVAWGAVIGMLPDADVVARLLNTPLSEELYHRGFTHSLFFAPLAAPIIATLLCKIYDKSFRSRNFQSWFWLAFWALITHPLLDLFTTYGTQLLAPLTNHRFSLSGVAVIDPAYSVPLLLVILIGLQIKQHILRKYLTSAMLLITTAYLFYGVSCNQAALAKARQSLEGQGTTLVNSYPTLFQIHVRRLVAHVGQQVWIAYTTTFPGADYPIRWKKYDTAPPWVCEIFLNTPEAQVYDWFCDKDYALLYSEDRLKMQDLRFGFTESYQLGLWGIEAKINKDGSLQERPHKFHHTIRLSQEYNKTVKISVNELARASLGYESRFLGIYN